MMQELLKVAVSLHHGKHALNESHVASDMLPFLMAGECAPSCAVELCGQCSCANGMQGRQSLGVVGDMRTNTGNSWCG